ncbi:MAG TPA: DegV family protein [Actinocrinis sp.]|nr:DegV family protein [Actinocrinis sp.]
MTDRTAVVTDSTACLPDRAAAEAAVNIVPLQVVIGVNSYTEGTPEARTNLLDALRHRQPASTSRPAPEQFAAQYRVLAEAGATGIVSVHLSGDLSATYESALLAAAQAPIPVEVVDSRSVGLGLGFAALAAGRAALAGQSLAVCADVAAKRAAHTSAFFYVDTLEQLRQGGRIGPAAALFGSALAVKPLLHLVDGRVELLEKVRTSARAIARLEQLAVERAGVDQVDIAVHHLASLPRAELLTENLRNQLPGLGELTIAEVGAVLGAHAGLGLLAVVVSPRFDY